MIYLLDVIKDLVPKYPNLKLLIIGDGPDFEEYQDIAKKYKIIDNVIMTGKVPWEKVPYYYHLSNIFLTASVTETQGVTVIEAMASGIPPICINDESFTNVVIDDLNGKIFQTKKECKMIISKLYENREIVSKLGNQAKINSERYSSKYFAQSVLDVYQHAIENKKARTGLIGKLVDKVKGNKDEVDNK